MSTRVGLIADTHGLLREAALAALQGADHIIHAGDVGGPEVLERLGALAPVTAVRGNNDHGDWASRIAEVERVRFGAVTVHVLHDVGALGVEPAGTAAHVIVSGHSHRPTVQRRAGALYVNPGSAGPRRFRLPVAVGELLIDGEHVEARIIELPV